MKLAYVLFGVIFLVIGYSFALVMAPDWWFASTGALVLLLLLGAVAVFQLDKDKLIPDYNDRLTWKSVIDREGLIGTKEEAEKTLNSMLRDIHLDRSVLKKAETLMRKLGEKRWINLARTAEEGRVIYSDVKPYRPSDFAL